MMSNHLLPNSPTRVTQDNPSFSFSEKQEPILFHLNCHVSLQRLKHSFNGLQDQVSRYYYLLICFSFTSGNCYSKPSYHTLDMKMHLYFYIYRCIYMHRYTYKMYIERYTEICTYRNIYLHIYMHMLVQKSILRKNNADIQHQLI